MDVPAHVKDAVEKSSKRGKPINRPHWKDLCKELSDRNEMLEKQVEHLRANGTDRNDLAKIKAEAFAAGVAAASSHFMK